LHAHLKRTLSAVDEFFFLLVGQLSFASQSPLKLVICQESQCVFTTKDDSRYDTFIISGYTLFKE